MVYIERVLGSKHGFRHQLPGAGSGTATELGRADAVCDRFHVLHTAARRFRSAHVTRAENMRKISARAYAGVKDVLLTISVALTLLTGPAPATADEQRVDPYLLPSEILVTTASNLTSAPRWSLRMTASSTSSSSITPRRRLRPRSSSISKVRSHPRPSSSTTLERRPPAYHLPPGGSCRYALDCGLSKCYGNKVSLIVHECTTLSSLPR